MDDLNPNKMTENTEIFISKALRFGVIISALVISIGLMLFIITGKSGYPSDTFPTSIVEIFKGLMSLKSFAIILTGLILLIMTPIFRVGISIFVFFKEKNYLYMVITSIVFLILIVSLILGHG